jgi:hypothetical protein
MTLWWKCRHSTTELPGLDVAMASRFSVRNRTADFRLNSRIA